MEEINIKDLLYYFKKNIFIIIELILVSVIIAEVYIGFFEKPMYRSETTVLVHNDNVNINSNEFDLNNQFVKTYSEIIKSRTVLSKVIRELGLNYNVSELSSMIHISAVKDTQVIKISVVNSDNKKAKQIANTLVRKFSEETNRIYGVDNVRVIDEAVIAKAPYNVSGIKTLVLAFLIGLFLGSAIVFVKYYFDDTIKTIEDVEKSLNIPIMGVIPKQNINKKEGRGYRVRRINHKK